MKTLLSYHFIKRITPWQQALLIGITAMLGIILMRMISSNKEVEWFLAVSALGFYVWMNVILGFFRKEKWLWYVAQSICCFILLGIFLLFMAQQLSTVPIAREYYIMLAATGVFYSCASSLVALARQVVQWFGIEY